ncbi:hypothetical protein KY284_011426 [Solanum tuberosum]|nr:hypothetical protein KY284_011426 [Solanum tuberosum]
MCLLAVPFECYRCRWREPRGPKYVVLKLWGIDSWIQDSEGVEMEDCNSKECFGATANSPCYKI